MVILFIIVMRGGGDIVLFYPCIFIFFEMKVHINYQADVFETMVFDFFLFFLS